MHEEKNGNPSIKCSVSSCAYHGSGLCTLSHITVGHTQQNVSKCEATECSSFQLGDHGPSCGWK